MAVTSVPSRSIAARTAWMRRLQIPAAIVVAGIIVSLVAGSGVPTWLNSHIQPWAQSVFAWITRNRNTNLLFTGFLTPIGHAINDCVHFVWWILRLLRWTGVLAVTGIVGWRTGGRRAAVTGTLSMAMVGVLGFWDDHGDCLLGGDRCRSRHLDGAFRSSRASSPQHPRYRPGHAGVRVSRCPHPCVQYRVSAGDHRHGHLRGAPSGSDDKSWIAHCADGDQ
jgi:hypothetical protein